MSISPSSVPPGILIPGWEMLEEDYILHQFESWQRTVAYNLRQEREDLVKLGPNATKRRSDLAVAIHIDEHALEEARQGLPAYLRQRFHHQYLTVVRRALKSGEAIPDDVLAQYPEFVIARNARARYEKGRHTSFANRSAGIDDSMLAARGFKIKRQDGKPLTPEILDDILRGMDDIEAVLGSLADLARATDLTVSHTNGKHPFLSKAVGLYSVEERTVSMGHWIRSLGHEIGHWLDFQSGHAQGLLTVVVTGHRKYKQISSWTEQAGYSTHTDMARRMVEIYEWAGGHMNNWLEIRRILKTPYQDVPEAERESSERVKIQLGWYYHTLREIWARLFEMYLSTRLDHPSPAVEPSYWTITGYWNEENWAYLDPMVDEVVHYLLATWRAKLAEPKVDS